MVIPAEVSPVCLVVSSKYIARVAANVEPEVYNWTNNRGTCLIRFALMVLQDSCVIIKRTKKWFWVSPDIRNPIV